MRQRGVDLHGFQRFDPLLFGDTEIQRAHIVQAVRQLDDDNPDILGHGQQHFTDIFRLLLRPAGIRDIGELGDTVHQLRYIGAELLFDVLQRDGGILHHIVQKRADDGIGIHAESHQNNGDRNGVRDVRIAGGAYLTLMRLFRQLVGRFDPGQVV